MLLVHNFSVISLRNFTLLWADYRNSTQTAHSWVHHSLLSYSSIYTTLVYVSLFSPLLHTNIHFVLHFEVAVLLNNSRPSWACSYAPIVTDFLGYFCPFLLVFVNPTFVLSYFYYIYFLKCMFCYLLNPSCCFKPYYPYAACSILYRVLNLAYCLMLVSIFFCLYLAILAQFQGVRNRHSKVTGSYLSVPAAKCKPEDKDGRWDMLQWSFSRSSRFAPPPKIKLTTVHAWQKIQCAPERTWTCHEHKYPYWESNPGRSVAAQSVSYPA
jgi:hypothetical protein